LRRGGRSLRLLAQIVVDKYLDHISLHRSVWEVTKGGQTAAVLFSPTVTGNPV
jgi:hypothetical protein